MRLERKFVQKMMLFLNNKTTKNVPINLLNDSAKYGHTCYTNNLRKLMNTTAVFDANQEQGSLTEGEHLVQLTSLY
jgi:hypothetical protein